MGSEGQSLHVDAKYGVMYLSQGTGAFFLLVQRKEGPCYLQSETVGG